MKRIIALLAVVFGSFGSISAQAEYSLQPKLFLTIPQVDSCDLWDSLNALPPMVTIVGAVGERIYIAKKDSLYSYGEKEVLYFTVKIYANTLEPDYFGYVQEVFNSKGKRIGFNKVYLWYKDFELYEDFTHKSLFQGKKLFSFERLLFWMGLKWEKQGWT
jgi:hypothetical protein